MKIYTLFALSAPLCAMVTFITMIITIPAGWSKRESLLIIELGMICAVAYAIKISVPRLIPSDNLVAWVEKPMPLCWIATVSVFIVKLGLLN